MANNLKEAKKLALKSRTWSGAPTLQELLGKKKLGKPTRTRRVACAEHHKWEE